MRELLIPLRLRGSAHRPVHELGDLFGDQADEEHEHRSSQEQGAHVRKTAGSGVGVKIVAQAEQEKNHACWQEHLHG